MHLPVLKPIPTTRKVLDIFRGYNRDLRIREGEFRDMENLTSDHFPLIASRKPRSFHASLISPQGIIAKEEICCVDGPDFLIGQQRVAMNLSVRHEDCPKQLVSMGAYVLIFPDKMYINTVNPQDRGSLEAEITCEGVGISLCDAQGGEFTPQYIQNSVPQQPQNGEYWLDTSQSPAAMKQWAETAGMWVPVSDTYLCLSAPGIGTLFSDADAVTVTGVPEIEPRAVIAAKGADFLVFPGLITQSRRVNTPVTVTRKIPKMDFVIESGNRLWGCRYGLDDTGEPVNRIYASKLGDFRNWNSFLGLASDSYYVSLGTDGPFTGAITHLGVPLFFKEKVLHKIYGSQPSEFAVQDTPCRGVQPGCHGSLAIVGENLCYKSWHGVCLYDGSLPRDIGHPLGNPPCRQAVGGAIGGKYYLSMGDDKEWNLFVYDSVWNLWHREDDFHALGFATLGEELYAIDEDHYQIIGMLGTGETREEGVCWQAQTGELGLSDCTMAYISRLTLRLQLEKGAKLDVYAQYDHSPEWEHLACIRQKSLGTISIPMRPRRSDYLRLKFAGTGDCRIYALTKTIEKGSEVS